MGEGKKTDKNLILKREGFKCTKHGASFYLVIPQAILKKLVTWGIDPRSEDIEKICSLIWETLENSHTLRIIYDFKKEEEHKP